MRITSLIAAFVCTLAGLQASAQVPASTSQLLLTITEDWQATSGRLFRFERDGDRWQPVGSAVPVSIGRKGLAWGIGLHPAEEGPRKHEGDGRAPAGIFRLGNAFGYLPRLDTGLGYQPMSEDDYCIDVVDSPLYNQTVDAAEVGHHAVRGSSEGMRRDIHYGDLQYKKGIFVRHNPGNRPGAGSCIFMHLWREPSAPTAGCTALAEPAMDRLLGWLERDAQPVYVALPRAEYERLQAPWGLPEVPKASQ